MTRIRKYRSLMDSVLDDMAVGLSSFTPPTYTMGTWVDTDRFDIVPKKSWYEEQLRAIDQELVTLERQQESSLKYYENQRKILQERKEKLEQEKANK